VPNSETGSRSFLYLEKAYERWVSWLVTILVDAELDPLRSDSRFDELLKLVGFDTRISQSF